MSDLSKYRDAVRELAETKSSLVFQNENANHASIVIETIIEFAKKEILVFDGVLDGGVSNRSQTFLKTLRDAAAVGKTIHFVVEERFPTDSDIQLTLEALSVKYPHVDVRFASKAFMDDVVRVRASLDLDQKIHFAVGDGESYRLEFPTKSRKAFCSFYDPELAGLLSNIFIKCFDGCPEYFPSAIAAT